MGKVTVKIHGKEYTFESGDRDEEYVRELARYVDEKIEEVLRESKNISTLNLVVSACMSIADEYFRFKNSKVTTGKDIDKFLSRTKVLLTKVLKD
ncbi:MAG: hypothetical protein DRI36_02165 [Caldiserica bacterium]|nr:MAG: hypothetical protein DRI36_02165 [Caldisericota bacterium]